MFDGQSGSSCPILRVNFCHLLFTQNRSQSKRIGCRLLSFQLLLFVKSYTEESMAKLVHPLSDASIQRLVIGEKKTDGHCKGLMVERMKDGRIFWRIKFKAINDAGELAWTRRSLGVYP